MLRLYMDVHVKAAITAGLRRRGIDVVTAQEDNASPCQAGSVRPVEGGRMSLKEQVTQALEELSEAELAQLIEFLAFLKFRAQLKVFPTLEEAQLATLYAEFAEEDRELAEEGIADYTPGLLKEDAL